MADHRKILKPAVFHAETDNANCLDKAAKRAKFPNDIQFRRRDIGLFLNPAIQPVDLSATKLTSFTFGLVDPTGHPLTPYFQG
jgi:hypothetical protein